MLKRIDLSSPQTQGVLAALFSAGVLGFTPIFGKQAISADVAPLTLVMLRTLAAAAALWALYLFIGRRFIYIYPFGFAACLSAGVINGLGSLLYYSSLASLDAGLGQLLYTLYLIFLTLFSWLDGYRLSRFTFVRLGLALVAVVLLKWNDPAGADWGAALMMIGAGLLYALHLSINQRTLYDVPAPTVTLYSVSGMALTVGLAYVFSDHPALPSSPAGWGPVLALTVVTILSRLSLFLGVKNLGGLQAVMISLIEAVVAVLAAVLWLGEVLAPGQWLGAALLVVSVMLVTRERALGNVPQPKPWILIFTQWYAAIQAVVHPAAEGSKLAPPTRATTDQGD